MVLKIVQQVNKNKEQFVMTKNNKPEVVMLSVDECTEHMEARENLELLQMADARMKNSNQQENLSHDEILKEYNISEVLMSIKI